ncbi:MAG: Nif11-like leader peptide family natural product precursor [Pyrinomonadaceae bacterium]
MSQENFEQFRNVVLEDLSLQKQLRAFTKRDIFIARVVKLGAERGFQFTAEDVEEAMNANRRDWIERWI